MADADSYSVGGGNEWELVSLTASTYAAVPGPTLPLLDTDKTDTPPPAVAVFMSQHFNLPPEGGDVYLINQPDFLQDFIPPATTNRDDGVTDTDLNKNCSREELDDDGLTPTRPSDFSDKQKQSVTLDLDDVDSGPDFTRISAHHHGCADAAAMDDGIIDSATLSCLDPDVPVGSVMAVSSGAACFAAKKNHLPKIPCEEAWWKKTFSFLCRNAKESVTFRFIFVAATIVGLAILGNCDESQLQQLRLQFNVDSEKISCSVGEPLGHVKGSMIFGGSQHMQSPVAQV